MEKEIINTNLAPAPIGPYNQAVAFGNFLFVSGQIALDVRTRELKIDDLEAETELVMANLKAILSEAEMDFSNVLKSTIFLTDMGDFSTVNSIYGKYFTTENAPARETVQVAALPKDVHVEISMIAAR